MASDDNNQSVVIDDPDNHGRVASAETTSTTTTTTWWDRDKRPYWLGFLAPLALLPLLFVWGHTSVREDIQRDIRARALASLEQAGIPGLDVEVKGRDVTLTGALPQGVDAKVAHDTVRSLTGVRHVEESFREPAAAPTPTTTAVPAPTTTAAPAPTTTAAAAAAGAAAAAAQATTTAAPPPTTTAPPAKLSIRGITFSTASSQPTADGFAVIDEAAATLRANPNVRVRIEGHTDSQGNPASNLQLSNDRANRVRDELIARGIAADRMTSAGFGDTAPVADNATADGRAQNRRIDFVIL